jgi:hypothetical protein
MMTLVFFLEEPSAEEMLKGILPRILPQEVTQRFVVFQGKQDLEKQLIRRLKLWRTPNSRFFVLRDQDSGDCRAIKKKLVEKCREADKPSTLVRIACHELESFYLGDLQAVDKGLEIGSLSKLQNKRKYREPDRLPNPARELIALTKNCYQKVSGSRAISKYMDLENNLSHSFNTLVKAIKGIITDIKIGDCHERTQY